MTKKEIAEIRRRFNPEKACFYHICGYMVSEIGNILSSFDQSMSNMTGDEAELLMATVKKALSGTPGKNLIDISFTTAVVASGEEYKLLMDLRESELRKKALVDTLVNKIIQSRPVEGNYAIILLHDTYDVPRRSKNGETDDSSYDEVFRYILCAICPVATPESALSYHSDENELHNRHLDQLIKKPALGFMFPAFDDRSTNLYNALFYTKDSSDINEELITALFGIEAPSSAEDQKATVNSIIKETLGDDYDLEMANAIIGRIATANDAYKEKNGNESLQLSSKLFRDILSDCGADEEQTAAFKEEYDKTFGEDLELSANILDLSKKTEITTESVSIKVDAEHANKVTTKVLDGVKYIAIRVDEYAQVNGVDIAF